MKNIIFLFLLSILIGCKESDSTATVITNEFKLEFLNEVFSDTVDIQILHSKSELISNFGRGYMLPPLSMDHDMIKIITGSDFSYRTAYSPENTDLNELELISNSLLESDTVFIQKQRKSVSTIDLNELSAYGFKIFDIKGMSRNNFSYENILQSADSINQKTGNYSFLKFTIPIFNKEKNLAYMRLQKGSSQSAIILEKTNNRWKRKTLLYGLLE
ncbi:hypothetical protein [Nonlabens sp.]|uniref:hypothetical protein n=1 Tax=Nonlabens sp. TaxID=1888209 RepID=UPI0032636451